ncbi:MAG: hypothetical protein FVQ81_17960 [Candidatus Glassbacteria bacterium]|nr:hypothetical protein [Candidatus Glassbacteria bacterium]
MKSKNPAVPSAGLSRGMFFGDSPLWRQMTAGTGPHGPVSRRRLHYTIRVMVVKYSTVFFFLGFIL